MCAKPPLTLVMMCVSVPQLTPRECARANDEGIATFSDLIFPHFHMIGMTAFVPDLNVLPAGFYRLVFTVQGITGTQQPLVQVVDEPTSFSVATSGGSGIKSSGWVQVCHTHTRA